MEKPKITKHCPFCDKDFEVTNDSPVMWNIRWTGEGWEETYPTVHCPHCGIGVPLQLNREEFLLIADISPAPVANKK